MQELTQSLTKTLHTMEDHSNLTTELKEALGLVASLIEANKRIIFAFEHSKYKDYNSLANNIFYNNLPLSFSNG